MSKFKIQKFFQKIEKKTMKASFFPVSALVSNFAGIGLEAKIETDHGLDLGKILQSRSWSGWYWSRLEP